MLNFSAVSNNSVIGKLLRFPLRLIPSCMVLPILLGSLKGKKWIVGSGNHGCWLGCYEYEKQILFAKMVKEGSVVYDIGANVEFYTLLASILVGSKGKVIAFEPVPRNLKYLKEHLRLNRCDNVTIIEAAVAERSGNAFFEEGNNYSTGHLSSKGNLKVKVVSLDNLIFKEDIPPPEYMKIDVEGEELLVLSGARAVIYKHHPIIFLAIHGKETHLKCCEFLTSIGYELQSIDGRDINETDEIFAEKCKVK